MAPGVFIDTTPDLDYDIPTAKSTKISVRTLLLAPPSLSAHPEALNGVLEAHDRNATDIQMLDRLALGLASLPEATYDVVVLLTDVDSGGLDPTRLLDRNTMEKIAQALNAGGRLVSQHGELDRTVKTEAVLAGLVAGNGSDMVKPSTAPHGQTVTLNFSKRKAKSNAAAVPANGLEVINTAKRKSGDISSSNGVVKSTLSGVGFVDTHDDFDRGYDDDFDEEIEIPSNEELAQADSIDPDTLLTEEDRKKPIVIPEKCKPNSKRRRACKDCSCGLAQRLEAEDKAKRTNADANLAKLSTVDLTEVDFTVQGKVGSCGNCALGDAFRCDGCPYIGLPAFKPGEEVRLLNNEVQL